MVPKVVKPNFLSTRVHFQVLFLSKDLIEVQVPVVLYVCELIWHILFRFNCVIAIRTKFWVLANPYGRDLGGIYLCTYILTISQVDIADFSTMYVKILVTSWT